MKSFTIKGLALCLLLVACWGGEEESPPPEDRTAEEIPADDMADDDRAGDDTPDPAGEPAETAEDGTPVPRPKPSGTESARSAETSDNPPTGQPVREAPPPAFADYAGTLAAISTTAMSITGDMTMKADVISFGNGQTMTTRQLYTVPASDAYSVDGESWAALITVPEQSMVEIREVIGIAINNDSRGLCDDTPISYVALGADRSGGKGVDAITAAMITGDVPPGPDAPGDNVCAIYTFAAEE